MQMIHTITRARLDVIRAVQMAANAPKKTALVSECPLGKLYVSGGVRSKKGTGRARLNVSLSVMFSSAAPIIVIAKSFASRPSFFIASCTMTMVVSTASASVDPTKEKP